MCWVLALIILVPILVGSVGLSSVLLGTSVISITTHQNWLKLSSLLFVITCYSLSANDVHSERDRLMSPLERIYDLLTMNDVGFGSGPEITSFLVTLIALSHAPIKPNVIAMTSLAVIALCFMEIKRRVTGEKDLVRRQRRH